MANQSKNPIPPTHNLIEAELQANCQRLRLIIFGAVQGVGFRPFVYRLATDLSLTGWIRNSNQGVFIEVEGTAAKLREFLSRLPSEKPAHAFIQSLESSYLDPSGFAHFEILPSDDSGEKSALILPDIAACLDCLREIFDPDDRRHLYPFTNCTNCGPRFTIIESLPYDRANTTMRVFEMCDACRAEYDDPRNRRFHAQPNACSLCGPHLELWDKSGNLLSRKHEALLNAAKAISAGEIVAVKGLGGFHLVVDAGNDAAIQRLRERKHREEKPFALMLPNLEFIKNVCELSPLEEQLITSSAAPIVIATSKFDIRNSTFEIAASVAPQNPCLGVMLPYAPLHHLLMRELGFPVVATSGNLSDEPICIDEHEATQRLAGIADLFLVHNRPIARHADDSIARVIADREMILRRARGYAPLPITLSSQNKHQTVLAVGAHLKNAIAMTRGNQVFVSQHIGDLETAEAFGAFEKVISDFKRLYDLQPTTVACDAHPNYLSTQYANSSKLPKVEVQHHHAHILSCMAENDLKPPVLGIAWDGTGLGSDGTIWGGEFLRASENGFERVAHLRMFPLPGGEAAVKEPRRSAIGLLFELFGDRLFAMNDLFPLQSFTPQERQIINSMLKGNVNSPRTSSAGRLFDAVASIIGLRQTTRFEGQAAMLLEFAAEDFATDEYYPLPIASTLIPQSPAILDWSPTITQILEDVRSGAATKIVAAKFHNALVEGMIEVARHVGEERLALSGGCFQNKYLTERAIRRFREEGFRPYWHQRIPPNDGGIALGQVVAAFHRPKIKLNIAAEN
jgi:hydrogenase maturation protein HypF